jgi:hypothetical protein
MAANAQITNSGVLTGQQVVDDIKEEVERLWQIAGAPLTSVAGTNAISASRTPPVTAYGLGQKFAFTVAATNTGAVTINVDGIGAKAVQDADGNALAAGQLVAGRRVVVEYGGAAFRVLAGLAQSEAASTVQVSIFTYETTNGVAGTSVAGGARQTYPLNTSALNEIPGCSLNTGTSVMTVPAGTYEYEAAVQVQAATASQLILRNTSDGADLMGARRQGRAQEASHVVGKFTLAATKSVILQIYAHSGTAQLGFNPASQAGIKEQWGFIRLRKVA